MASGNRYIINEQKFKEYAFSALSSQFTSRESFENFYASLSDEETKGEFLRVASHYLFLVKKGDWHVAYCDCDEIIDYLTNSYKVVSLFSIIESVSKEKYQDFHNWLKMQDPATTFPINDKPKLDELYTQYKESFGSIRRCVAFFNRLSKDRKKNLCAAVRVNGKPLSSVKKVANFLYDLRSKFVHEGQLVLQVSNNVVISKKSKDKIWQVKLTINVFMETFEEGVVAYFNDQRGLPDSST